MVIKWLHYAIYCRYNYIFVNDMVIVLFQGDDASQAASSGKALIWAKPLLSFVADNFLPLGSNVTLMVQTLILYILELSCYYICFMF